jgi:RNA polymerase sigma factor (sigma-70 family)
VLRERERVLKQNELTAFNQAVLPHLDAAYNLARWLTRNDQDAEDVVQEASLRAFKYWKGFSGRDCRSWLLTIVRNTYYSWVRQRSVQPVLTPDGEVDDVDESVPNPEHMLLQSADREVLKAALEDLPVEFREAIVLREMEGLSYKEIADIEGVPIGTVMSRLARARKRLSIYLTNATARNYL